MVGPEVLLEVDGGVNAETIGQCAAAGAQLFVVGSAIFKPTRLQPQAIATLDAFGHRPIRGLTKTMVQIVLIRPGSTDYDEQGRIQGTLDIPLNEQGTREVAADYRRHSHAGNCGDLLRPLPVGLPDGDGNCRGLGFKAEEAGYSAAILTTDCGRVC